MNKCKIYVEGIADQKFIADFISFHYNVSMIKAKFEDGEQIKNENLIDIEGKDSLHAVTPLFKINSAKNISNIVIFDADDNIKSRRKELQDFKNEKEANRNYKNEKHWNLNNSYLKPLKTFLDKYFI